MAIQVNNVILRNLQEQVEKNKQDIAKHYEIDRVLSDWGIKVLGVVNTPSDIPEGIYEYGDAYGVRTGSGIVYYVWTRANINVGQDEDYWLDIGALSIIGPTGPQGLQGPQGVQGVRGSLWVSSTTAPTSQIGNNGDQWLDTTTGDVYQKGTSTWTRTGNIKGPQGVQGPVGPKGDQGIQGPTGSQGPKGDTGSSFKIGGLLNSIDNLPIPTEANRSIGYAVARQDNTYDLYVVVGTDNLQWVNMGRVEGVEGPQGPVGPQGPAGADIQIVTITGIPSTATSGTLTQTQVQTLLAHPGNYIQFFNENFYPQDVEIEQGYIVYSHVGQIGSETKIKNINLTIATGGWVLTETSLVSAPISIVNELPEANEENFEKGKIYTTGELLQYISKVALSEPNLQQVSSLVNSAQGLTAAAVGTDIYICGDSTTNIYKYSTITNSITTTSVFSSSVNNLKMHSYQNNLIIIDMANATIYNYNTINNDLNVKYSITNSEHALKSAASVLIGSHIYIFGGYTSSYQVPKTTILVYDIVNNTLNALSTTLPESRTLLAAAAVGTDIYLFGGSGKYNNYGNPQYKNTIYKFSTTSNVITTLSTTLPTSAWGIAAAAVGTDIYLFGGGGSNTLNTINKFSTNDNSLITLSTTLPTTTNHIAAVLLGTNVYLFGGYTGSSNLNTINKVEFGFNYSFKTISTQ